MKTTITTILILSFICSEFAQGQGESPQFSFGYWNDNFDLEDLIGKKMKYGLDDYVTASFWLNASFPVRGRLWEADTYLNFITNRKAGYRTDLFTVRISTFWEWAEGILKVGCGTMSSGNFGGRSIQNKYHDSRGILRVNLPYSYRPKTGMYLGLEYDYLMGKPARSEMHVFCLNRNGLGMGFNSFRGGVRFRVREIPLYRTIRITPSLIIGHSIFYGLNGELDPIFESGVFYGIMINLSLTDHFGITAWTLPNQYRSDQGHHGIAFNVGLKSLQMPSFPAILFP